MTHSSRNKLLWKKRAHCAAPRVIIPAHLSPEDQEERRKSERLIFQNLNNRLEKEKDTLKLD
ncbi:MAG TPA: hypothetical protein VNT79_18280, partial [Phycisphaerae bacterium]|nr:hypothetical protein [Phycisphaerae bacterium]